MAKSEGLVCLKFPIILKGPYDTDHIIWTILPYIPWKDLMCYKCHNWSNPSHSNCLQPDNETPLVNCTEMYDGYELGQVVCESSE